MGIIVRNMSSSGLSNIRMGKREYARYLLDLNLMTRPSTYNIGTVEYNLVQSYWDGTDYYRVTPDNVTFVLGSDINSYTIDVEMNPQFIGLSTSQSNMDIFLYNITKSIQYGIYRNGVNYGGQNDGYIFESQYSTLPAATQPYSGVYRVQYNVNLNEYMYRIRYKYNDDTRRMVIVKNDDVVMYDQILPVSYKLSAGDSYKILSNGVYSTYPEHIRIKSIKIIEE